IKSRQPEESVHFYGLLGLLFQKHRHGNGVEHYSSTTGTFVMVIYPVESSKSVDDAVRLGFSIVNLAQLHDVLNSNGARVVVPPRESPWGLRLIVLDPDNNRVE